MPRTLGGERATVVVEAADRKHIVHASCVTALRQRRREPRDMRASRFRSLFMKHFVKRNLFGRSGPTHAEKKKKRNAKTKRRLAERKSGDGDGAGEQVSDEEEKLFTHTRAAEE